MITLLWCQLNTTPRGLMQGGKTPNMPRCQNDTLQVLGYQSQVSCWHCYGVIVKPQSYQKKNKTKQNKTKQNKTKQKHNSVVIWVLNATPLGLQYSNNTYSFFFQYRPTSFHIWQLGLAYELDVRLFHPEGPGLVSRRLETSHAAGSGTLMFVLGLHLDGLCWA